MHCSAHQAPECGNTSSGGDLVSTSTTTTTTTTTTTKITSTATTTTTMTTDNDNDNEQRQRQSTPNHRNHNHHRQQQQHRLHHGTSTTPLKLLSAATKAELLSCQATQGLRFTFPSSFGLVDDSGNTSAPASDKLAFPSRCLEQGAAPAC